jgi:DNA repair protein RecO (recombination protein O)
MEWRDEGILLSVRRHGETSAIIDVFTVEHGRHSGIVRGGVSRKIAPILQPGAQLDVSWRARLEDHLGTYTVELLRSRAAAALADRMSLAGLNAVTALLGFALPEREPDAKLYKQCEQLLDLMGQHDVWPLAYLRFEIALLEACGMGLDLSACAVTGTNRDLRYISPRTGRAVSEHGAGEWADKLLPLPPILKGDGTGADAEIAQAFQTTGYFLSEKLAHSLGNRALPEARARYVDLFNRAITQP